MKVIISENKFERSIQNKLDKTLTNLKMDAEANPKDYTKRFSENIDNVDGIKVMSIDVLKVPELKFDIEVEVILDNDIPFDKWDIVAEILTEIAWIIKNDLMIKLKISLGKLTIKNKTTDW
jgi:hypothetical protein